jgi:hypothetical protein
MVFSNKKEVIPFKDFMSPPAASIRKKIPLQTVYSFLPPFTIKSFLPVGIDPMFTIFLVAGGVVVLVAVSEYLLAEAGFTEISGFMTGLFKFLLPVVGYGSILWFLATL